MVIGGSMGDRSVHRPAVADAAGVVAAMLTLSGRNFTVAILGSRCCLACWWANHASAVLISYPGVPAIIGALGS
ncbi:MAG: hypothetical protein ACLTT1_03400 [[Clostridium] scindens]